MDITASLQEYYRKFIDGCHILHLNQVLDAYGHLSFRHPLRSDVFIMSHSVAPGLITCPADLITYRVDDAEPVEETSHKGHSESVVPYAMSSVPLKACYHMAGFLGSHGVTVFDIAQHRDPARGADMLVRDGQTGEALAKTFDNNNNVTLMRGHGFTVVADSIEVVVMWATYTQKNASIQTVATALQSTYAGAGLGIGLTYLSDEECSVAQVMTKRTVQRPWNLWTKEVKASGLYINTI